MPILVTTADVLRTITPTTLASLVVLDNGTATTQTEIADVINRDQSTVSSSFQSLMIENTDIALVEKSDQSYELTDTGKEVLDLVTDTRQLGTELNTVDWGSEKAKEQIAERFAPLSGSRSVEPFLLLDSLTSRSKSGGTHEGLQSVEADKTVRDIENRLQKIDRTTSKPKLRQITERFAERNAVVSDGDRLTLTEKGQRHADLLNQVAEVVSQRVEPTQNDEPDSPSVDELALQMRRGRLATSYSLENDDPELVDESHIYHELKRIDVLDTPNDDWHSYRWLTVENNGTAPTNSIAHKESGDTKITFEDMDLAAFLDNRDGRQLEIENLTDYEPAIEQKMAIYFPNPLPPGESLTIYYQISWPNELAHYPEGELDQTISLTRYPQGVGKLQFGIMDKKRHVGVDCEKFLGEKDKRWKPLSTVPKNIDAANQRSELEPIHGEGYDGYIYTIPSPIYPGYRIAYTHRD
jgi:DNA-binding MarR family transcriptional regulator